MLQRDADRRPSAKQVLVALAAMAARAGPPPPPSAADITLEMSSRRPKTLTDGERNAQLYDGLRGSGGSDRAARVFGVLLAALEGQRHGWAVRARAEHQIVGIEHAGHAVVCQVVRCCVCVICI